MIEVELFDGTVLEFPEGTSQEVIDRVVRQETASRRQAAPAETAAPAEAAAPAELPSAAQQLQERGFTSFVAEYRDGQIFENPQTGERAFVSPSYVTQDQEVISNMMQGITPAETQRGQMQDPAQGCLDLRDDVFRQVEDDLTRAAVPATGYDPGPQE